MKLTTAEIKEIIKQELRKILKEFKEPKAAQKIEITVRPDFEEAQAEILRQFAIPQEQNYLRYHMEIYYETNDTTTQTTH